MPKNLNYERSPVPGLPQSRSAPVNPLRRLEQLRRLANQRYPSQLSWVVALELRKQDLRDYRSILAEVCGYVRFEMGLYQAGMAERQEWDLDDLIKLHWQIQKAFAKLRLAPYVPVSWRDRFVRSAEVDFATFAPLAKRT